MERVKRLPRRSTTPIPEGARAHVLWHPFLHFRRSPSLYSRPLTRGVADEKGQSTNRGLSRGRARFLRSKLGTRARGLPRSLTELERSLLLLATMRDLGWQRSMPDGLPRAADGQPVPWYTYPAISWLEQRIGPDDDVFEFGAGQSTLWYANRVRSVLAVDSSPVWVDTLNKCLPSNGHVELCDPALFPQAIPAHDFDVVVIDGAKRSACAEPAYRHLSRDGLVIFDNSDRPNARVGMQYLAHQGLLRIDFVGPIPGYGHPACTSVFCRPSTQRWLTPSVLPRFLGF